MMRRVPVALAAILALAACQPEQATAPQTTTTAPEGTTFVESAAWGYTVSVPDVYLGDRAPAGSADLAFANAGAEASLTLTATSLAGTSRAARFEAAMTALQSQGIFIAYSEMRADRFVVWGKGADEQVLVNVTQFGVDCAGAAIAGEAIVGFNNDRSPLAYHFTNSHPLFPRFNFAQSCP